MTSFGFGLSESMEIAGAVISMITPLWLLIGSFYIVRIIQMLEKKPKEAKK